MCQTFGSLIVKNYSYLTLHCFIATEYVVMFLKISDSNSNNRNYSNRLVKKLMGRLYLPEDTVDQRPCQSRSASHETAFFSAHRPGPLQGPSVLRSGDKKVCHNQVDNVD